MKVTVREIKGTINAAMGCGWAAGFSVYEGLMCFENIWHLPFLIFQITAAIIFYATVRRFMKQLQK